MTNRVDIDFASQNPTWFSVNAPVELLVDIKNVKKLNNFAIGPEGGWTDEEL